MEPFRDREMDSSQRSSSMDGSQGSQRRGQPGSSPPRVAPPSRPPTAGAAALARPPAFGSGVGGASMGTTPGPSPNLMPNQRGYGYTGRPIPAQPGQQQQQQQQLLQQQQQAQQQQNQQRLLQMQRQQQLRQLHAQQRRHPTAQQTHNLSQLQQNYMQHLAADGLENSQRSTGSASSTTSANVSGADHNLHYSNSNSSNVSNAPQQGVSTSIPNGIPHQPPPSSTLMMNQRNNQMMMMMNMNRTNSHSSLNINNMPSAPILDQTHRRNPQSQQPQHDSTAGQSQTTKPTAATTTTTKVTTKATTTTTTATRNPDPTLRTGMGPTNVAGERLHPNMPPPSTGNATTHTNGNTASLNTGAAIAPQGPTLPPLPSLDEKQIPGLLAKCDFKDKTLWVSRQLLGGQALNKFLGSTANVQRIKRQRVRQLRTKDTTTTTAASGKGKTDDGASVNSNPSLAGSGGGGAAAKKREGPPLEDDPEVKLQVMNSRTAKKIKSEMEVGLKFCGLMHETIRGILKELDVPSIAIPAPLGPELPAVPADKMPSLLRNANAPKSATALPKAPVVTKQTRAAFTTSAPSAAAPASMAVPPVVQPPPPMMSSPQSAMAAGSAKHSTLRRTRRKKLPPSNSLNVGLSEFDATGKRLVSKKDFSQRIFEVVRFRALQQGDHVAARLTSRDLWILARVTNDYPSVSMPSVEFLQLSGARRDALFREKVLLQDVEDRDSGPNAVSRNLVLPLPRSYSEAAEWGQHYRKGSRVYAMYPETTSLYTGTVFDNTTYCQGDDDIIVVEFDGDEPDHTGSPPKCHIPARFVTLIPREFPSFQDKAVRRQSSASVTQPGPTGRGFAGFADPLNNLDLTLDTMESFDGFDDLDFDLGLGN